MQPFLSWCPVVFFSFFFPPLTTTSLGEDSTRAFQHLGSGTARACSSSQAVAAALVGWRRAQLGSSFSPFFFYILHILLKSVRFQQGCCNLVVVDLFFLPERKKDSK